eukprot:600166-Rhodomonas_salina.1
MSSAADLVHIFKFSLRVCKPPGHHSDDLGCHQLAVPGQPEDTAGHWGQMHPQLRPGLTQGQHASDKLSPLAQ